MIVKHDHASADGWRDTATLSLDRRRGRLGRAIVGRREWHERAAVTAGVTAARERIDDDPAAGQTLADLAAAAGLSRYQFLRAFTRLTGLPPHAYLLQRRVQHARRLVRGGLPLAEAAAASGFADQSHMTRCFARSFGLTPGAFTPFTRR